MTREESDINEARNVIVRACDHEPARESVATTCKKCGCSFAVVMFPVLAKPAAYHVDCDGELAG